MKALKIQAGSSFGEGQDAKSFRFPPLSRPSLLRSALGLFACRHVRAIAGYYQDRTPDSSFAFLFNQFLHLLAAGQHSHIVCRLSNALGHILQAMVAHRDAR
jgi:hypothetical protein